MRRAVILASNGPPGDRQLRWAVKDGEQMAKLLAGPRCAFVEIKSSLGESATDARDKLFAAADACTDEDIFLVHFSGHGLLDRGSLFILFDDSNPEKLLSTTLDAQEVMRAMI